MTDKEKIKAFLESLKKETSIGLSEWENGVEHGRMEIIEALSSFIDSLQEEPKLKFGVGDTIISPTAAVPTKHTIRSIYGNNYILEDGSSFSTKTQDQWELVENLCTYSTNRYTEKDRKVLCAGCEEDCWYSKKEELVCKVWHEPIERPNSNKVVLIIVRCGYIGDSGMPHLAKYDSHNNQYIDKDRTDVCNRPIMYHVDSVEKWVYIDDILNLTAKEEPVSVWHDADKERPKSHSKLVVQRQ